MSDLIQRVCLKRKARDFALPPINKEICLPSARCMTEDKNDPATIKHAESEW